MKREYCNVYKLKFTKRKPAAILILILILILAQYVSYISQVHRENTRLNLPCDNGSRILQLIGLEMITNKNLARICLPRKLLSIKCNEFGGRGTRSSPHSDNTS